MSELFCFCIIIIAQNTLKVNKKIVKKMKKLLKITKLKAKEIDVTNGCIFEKIYDIIFLEIIKYS